MNWKRALYIGCIICGIAAIGWTGQSVIRSYTTEYEAVQITLTGVDLVSEQAEVEASPFFVEKAPDTRRQPSSLAFVPSVEEKVSPVALTGGSSRLEGSVVDPDGQPVEGAIVRIERHTLADVASRDVRTGENGVWGIGDLQGGRYRVRSWVPGSFAMNSSVVLFLEHDPNPESEAAVLAYKKLQEEIVEQKVEQEDIVQKVDLQLVSVDPEPFLELLDAGSIYKGLTGTVAVRALQNTVDAEGIVITEPLSNVVVEVSASSIVRFESNRLVTDEDGTAYVKLRCLSTGSPSAVFVSGEISLSTALPSCIAQPPPPEPKKVEPVENKNTGTSSATTRQVPSSSVPKTSNSSESTAAKTTVGDANG